MFFPVIYVDISYVTNVDYNTFANANIRFHDSGMRMQIKRLYINTLKKSYICKCVLNEGEFKEDTFDNKYLGYLVIPKVLYKILIDLSDTFDNIDFKTWQRVFY